MNYIKRIENENREKAAELIGLRAGVQDLKEYLSLPKFEDDSTVQVKDVLNRLQDAENRAQWLLTEQKDINGKAGRR